MLVEGCNRLGGELCSFGPRCSLGVEPFQSSTLGKMTSHTLFKLYKDNRGLKNGLLRFNILYLFKVFLVAQRSHMEMKDVAYSMFKYKGIGKFFFLLLFLQ